MDGRKLRSQLDACAEIVAHELFVCLRHRQPADRALAALLRERSFLGSRDRRLISQAVFAVFRWWGWVRMLVPEHFWEVASTHELSRRDVCRPREWSGLLLTSLLFDGAEFGPAMAVLAEDVGVDPETLGGWIPEDDLAQRGIQVFDALRLRGLPGRPRLEDLVPDWTCAEIGDMCDVRQLITWLQRRPPMWLRIQVEDCAGVVQELRDLGLDVEQHPRLTHAVKTMRPQVNLYAKDVYRKGRIEIQDLASQSAGAICDPQERQRWWDACAGAGGKSLLLAHLMRGTGKVVASDVREYKLDDLRRRARRAAFPNIERRSWNGRRVRDKQANFDGVLVDAPCTCSGTWRRNPDAKWSVQPEDVGRMSDLQFRILENAATGLRPGGVLVYSTCSMFREENEGVVRRFLEAHPGYALEAFPHPMTGEPCDGMVQFWPWDGDCDAMFAARFRSPAS